jgi:hypothetical protein
MRFMMLMIPEGYEKVQPDKTPDPEAVKAMMAYNEELQKAGILLSLDGLHPPSDGARISFPGGKATVTHGPFPATRETLGGYWMIRVGSKDEAIQWASRIPVRDGSVVEVRQVFEMEEFPAEVRAEVDKFPELKKRAEQGGAG